MSFLPGEKKKLVDLCKETLGVLRLLQTCLSAWLPFKGFPSAEP